MSNNDADLFEHGEKYLTVEEVAARFRISKMTVYRMIDSGELRAYTFGRLFRIKLVDVEQVEADAVFVPPQEVG